MIFLHFAPPCVRSHPYGRLSMQLYCNVFDPGVVSEIRKLCICDTAAIRTAQINYGDLMLL